MTSRNNRLIWASDMIPDVIDQVQAAHEQQEKTGSSVIGLQTGFEQLDRILGGLGEGIYILSAAPAEGKTSFALQVSLTVARQFPVIYLTYENSPFNLVTKGICYFGQIDTARVRDGLVDMDSFRDAAGQFREVAERMAFVEGNDTVGSPVILDMVEQASAFHRCEKCLVVADYLQRMAPANSRKTIREQVTEVVHSLRDVVIKRHCPVLAISSQNRGGYRESTQYMGMDSLKESGDLEYSADAILMLERVLKGTTPSKRELLLHITKNRYGEAGSRIKFTFRPAICMFEEKDT